MVETSLLNDLIWEALVTIPLRRLDAATTPEKLSTTKAKKPSTMAVTGSATVKVKKGPSEDDEHKQLKSRTLIRGALMNALVSAAGGSDAILATEAAFQMACKPFKFLKLDSEDRESRLQTRILTGDDARLPDLSDELAMYFRNNPSPLTAITTLGTFIAERTLTNASKNLQPALPAAPSTTSTLPPPKVKRKRNMTSEAAATIILTTNSANFLPIALILREALNRIRGLKPANLDLYQILRGYGSDGLPLYPPEQTDPVRAGNAYACLMEMHLSPKRLTSKAGISALLSYMGSGQSSPTAQFLKANPGCFFGRVELTHAINSALAQNSAVKAQSAGNTSGRISGTVTFQNPAV